MNEQIDLKSMKKKGMGDTWTNLIELEMFMEKKERVNDHIFYSD